MATQFFLIVCITLLTYDGRTNAIPSKQFSCPEDCGCYFVRTNWVTDCSENNLTAMPYEGLDTNVYILNMNENFLKELEPFPANIKLRTLQLSENFLTKVEKQTFAGLHYLLDIDLTSNLISYIDPEAFVDSAGLITLKLQGNLFGSVEGSFLFSRSLLYLYLADCHLTQLSPHFFTNISRLAILDLSENPLQFIKAGIFDPLSSLNHLILNNCKLRHIASNAFSSLEHLTILELSGNNFNSHIDWTLIFGYLGRLERLELRHSGVKNLPDNTFFNNKWLTALVLAENELSDLDVATTLGHNLVHLNFLDLSNCNLNEPLSENAFTNASKLRTLILSGNNLSATDLDLALSPLSKLVKLSLQNCRLTRLPTNTFHKFTNLQELDVSENPLDISENPLDNAMTTLLSPLESLKYLNMGYCNLQNVSSTTFMKMSALKTLILSGNSLEFGLFQNLTQLEVLELNNCGLNSLNNLVFSNNFTYPCLEELRLSGNPLIVPKEGPILPPQLSGLKNLDLSKCNLSYLPNNAFITTPNLSQLLLNDNNLNNEENSSMQFLEPLVRLEKLDLSFNNISSIKPDKFQFNYELMSLKLTGNPWKCNCYVVDMWEWALLSKGNLGVLVGSTRSVFSTTYKKDKGLICSSDSKSISIKATKLRRPNTSLKLSWARYVRNANCSFKGATTRSAKIVTREVHGYEPMLLTTKNVTENEWIPIVSICAILLVIIIVIISVFIHHQKNSNKETPSVNYLLHESNSGIVQIKVVINVTYN